MLQSAAALLAGWKLECANLRRKITSFCKHDRSPLPSFDLLTSRIRQMEETLVEYDTLTRRFSRSAPRLVIVETDEAARKAIQPVATEARCADLTIAKGPPAARAAHSRRIRGGADRHMRVDNRRPVWLCWV